MKTLTLIATLLLMTMSAAQAKDPNPEDFSGEIVFKDGSKVEYIWLKTPDWDKLYYSRDIESSRDRKIRLSDIARMDFTDMTKNEKDKVTNGNWTHKAKVTFRDGTVWENIYLYGLAWEWKSRHDEGYVENAANITFNLKGAKKCSKCSRQFKEPDRKFCPFDGVALK